MNLNYNTIRLNSICEGCLSTDRKLSVLNDNKVKEEFHNFIGELNFINNSLSLCWECAAVIKRIIKYKEQVQNAHRHLIQYTLHRSKLTSLSTLKTHTISEESHLILTECDKSNNSEKSPLRSKRIVRNNYIKPDEKDSSTPLSISVNNTGLAKREKETPDEIVTSGKEREPVFIKVENVSENNFEQEFDCSPDRCYDEEDIQNDLKAVLDSDPPQYRSKSSGKKSNTKTTSDFNDSDDEPLKKKKSNAKKRKKKKETGCLNIRRKDPRTNKYNCKGHRKPWPDAFGKDTYHGTFTNLFL